MVRRKRSGRMKLHARKRHEAGKRSRLEVFRMMHNKNSFVLSLSVLIICLALTGCSNRQIFTMLSQVDCQQNHRTESRLSCLRSYDNEFDQYERARRDLLREKG